jgi:short-subunit dehydrogenase
MSPPFNPSAKPLAVVTGASSGIGLELARCCAAAGFDLVVAADQPTLDDAAEQLRQQGAQVQTVQADLATAAGVERLVQAIGGRAVDALLANAGHGLGQAFLDQDFMAVRHLLDTNITGTLELIHRVGRTMRERGRGRILVTGSIAGHMPGSFHAVYNASKAFIDSFAYALRSELKDSGVTVTCLMPGATDTEFFDRAELSDTKLAQQKRDDPADVAQAGFEAMMKGDDGVVTGLRNKLQVAAAAVMPSTVGAEAHRKLAQPGSADPAKARELQS